MNTIHVAQLTQNIASKYQHEFNNLLSRIPLVTHDSNELLSLNKGNRIMHQKWIHSLFATSDQTVVGVLIAYERETDEYYRENTLYISEIAVRKSYERQGIGTIMMKKFLSQAKLAHFALPNIRNISLQTNSATSNQPTQNFYEKFGFIQNGSKKYPNRIDRIYTLPISQVLP